MKIIFGVSTLKPFPIELDDIGETNNTLDNIHIVVVQKYFHLFWIPFSSIGKDYFLVKNEEYLSPPDNYKYLIKERKLHKTPWYTFLLPILIILGIILFMSFDYYKGYRLKQLSKKSHEKSINILSSKLNKLDTTDYLKLTRSNKFHHTKGIFAKVERIKSDSILLKKMTTNLDYRDNVSFLIQEYYYTNKSFLDSAWIKKNNLTSLLCRNYDSLRLNIEFGVDIFNEGKSYLINDIEHIDDGPVIKPGHSGSYGKTLKIDLYNFGFSSELIKIENIEGNVNWINKLPKLIERSEHGRFRIKGDNYTKDSTYNFIIHFRSEDKIFKYRIYGKNLTYEIEKMQ